MTTTDTLTDDRDAAAAEYRTELQKLADGVREDVLDWADQFAVRFPDLIEQYVGGYGESADESTYWSDESKQAIHAGLLQGRALVELRRAS